MHTIDHKLAAPTLLGELSNGNVLHFADNKDHLYSSIYAVFLDVSQVGTPITIESVDSISRDGPDTSIYEIQNTKPNSPSTVLSFETVI